MKAFTTGAGIVLHFGTEDRKILEQGGAIEKKFGDHPEKGIKVHICDVVGESRDSALLEPGYGLEVTSAKIGWKYCELWISKERARELLDEGYLLTRSMIDRINMKYFE